MMHWTVVTNRPWMPTPKISRFVLSFGLTPMSANALSAPPKLKSARGQREPYLATAAAQNKAPTTPPRLYAVKPEPATLGLRPSFDNIVGSQLNALYTASRHAKHAIHSAIVSR